MNSYLGIDPGQTGAVAVIHPDGYEVFDWPGDEVAAADIVRSLALRYKIKMAAIEDLGAGPPKGKLGYAKLSENKGIWRGLMAYAGIPFRLVRPQEWQKGIVPKKEGTVKPSLTVARRMFPLAELGRQKDHGRADALLIAEWARRQG